MLPSRASSMSIAATIAPAISSAIPRMSVRSSFSISLTWFNRDNEYSCKDFLLAPSKNVTGTWPSISISPWVGKSIALAPYGVSMGVTRKTVSAKLDQLTFDHLESLRLTHWPWLSTSGLINVLLGDLTHRERAGLIELTPASIQGKSCQIGTPARAEMSHPKRMGWDGTERRKRA